jgi:beta-fructofuranosidase
MWECPDLIRLDGKDVLLVSPQELFVDGMEFIDGNTTLCLIGKLNDDGSLYREHEQTIDYGLDFYAPQTVLTSDGRRVMIAWMQYWNSVNVRPIEDLPFNGQMTLPRELSVRNGRLIQNPVRELEKYRKDEISYSDVLVDSGIQLENIKGRCIDMTVNIRPSGGKEFDSFTINAALDGDHVISMIYHPKTLTVDVDRSKCGWPEDILNYRTFGVRDNDGKIEMRIIIDRYSLELFVNQGEQAATFVIFPPDEADGISFDCDGEALMDVRLYNLDFD